jgi:hypothetical protein
MKDIVTPVPPEEVRSTIKKSLENAALDNYTRLSAEAKIEGEFCCFCGVRVNLESFLTRVSSSQKIL